MLDIKTINHTQNSFLLPKSLVGRSILLLMLLPFISICLRLIYFFLNAIYLSPRALENLKLCNDKIWNKILERYFTAYLPEFFLENMAAYLDGIFSFGLFVLCVYTLFRFVKINKFSSQDYRKIWIIASAVLILKQPIISFGLYFFGSSDESLMQGISLGNSIFDAIYFGLKFAIALYLINLFFNKLPFDGEPTWNNEISFRQFISFNFNYLKNHISKKQITLIFIICLTINFISYAVHFTSYI